MRDESVSAGGLGPPLSALVAYAIAVVASLAPAPH